MWCYRLLIRVWVWLRLEHVKCWLSYSRVSYNTSHLGVQPRRTRRRSISSRIWFCSWLIAFVKFNMVLYFVVCGISPLIQLLLCKMNVTPSSRHLVAPTLVQEANFSLSGSSDGFKGQYVSVHNNFEIFTEINVMHIWLASLCSSYSEHSLWGIIRYQMKCSSGNGITLRALALVSY